MLKQFSAGMFVVLVSIAPETMLAATEIRINGDPCSDALHVQAADAQLSDLLKQLADRGRFRLKFDPKADRQVSINKQGSMADILRNVMTGQTLLLLEDVTAECGHRTVVTEAWILPEGDDVDYVDYTPSVPDEPAPVERLPRIFGPDGMPLPRGTRRQAQSDEEFQALKEKAQAGEIVAHPDTGEPISRKEYEQLMQSRGEAGDDE